MDGAEVVRSTSIIRALREVGIEVTASVVTARDPLQEGTRKFFLLQVAPQHQPRLERFTLDQEE
eukprot:5940121-Prorocentrum_lima.AAC.1